MYITPYLIAYNTIVIKEVSRFMRIWVQTIIPPAVSMTLYFVIFGNLIGPRIGRMEGFSYVEFIAPGIIMMAIMNSSYANVVSSFFWCKISTTYRGNAGRTNTQFRDFDGLYNRWHSARHDGRFGRYLCCIIFYETSYT